MIEYYGINTKGKDYFVGDIHGEISKFRAKLQEVNFNFVTDRVFSVGDLVDRGEDSLACVDLLDCPWFHAVQGNHENMAIRFPLGNMDSDLYIRNGGRWNFQLCPEDSKMVADKLSTLPYMIEVKTEQGTIGIIHAEVLNNDWEYCKNNLDKKSTKEHILWNRDKITHGDAAFVEGIDFVVVGHTPMQKPYRLGNMFYIDTGACFGKELTLLSAEELLKI